MSPVGLANTRTSTDYAQNFPRPLGPSGVGKCKNSN